jgi:hypothetical protein
MKCLRIYATADGGSHFGEVDLRFCVAVKLLADLAESGEPFEGSGVAGRLCCVGVICGAYRPPFIRPRPSEKELS